MNWLIEAIGTVIETASVFFEAVIELLIPVFSLLILAGLCLLAVDLFNAVTR